MQNRDEIGRNVTEKKSEMNKNRQELTRMDKY